MKSKTTMSNEVANARFGVPDLFRRTPNLPPGANLIKGSLKQGWRLFSTPFKLSDPNFTRQAFSGRSPMIHRVERRRALVL